MKIYERVVISMKTMEVVEEESFDYQGELALCGGGGAGSGTVQYAEYLEDTHSQLLVGEFSQYNESGGSPVINFFDFLRINRSGVGDTPYTDDARPSAARAYTGYDADLTTVENKLSEYETLVDSMANITDWQTYIDTVVAKVAESDVFPDADFIDNLSTALSGAITAAEAVLSSAPIKQAVDAFEARQLIRFNRQTGQWAAGMATANAVNSSSFVIGMALRQAEFEKEITGFESNLNMDTYRSVVLDSIRAHMQAMINRNGRRDLLLTTAVQEMITLLQLKTKGTESVVIHTGDVKKTRIDAENYTANYNLQLDVKETLWDFELLKGASSALSNISGAAVVPEAPTKWQGALSGAASGASIGAKFNMWGAGIGALIGGIGGALAQ